MRPESECMLLKVLINIWSDRRGMYKKNILRVRHGTPDWRQTRLGYWI